MKKLLDFFLLFTSVSTLFCCALPALFVSIGFGAAFVSLLNVFPQLIWFSEHKIGIFIFAGTMLLANGFLRRYAKTQVCPVDVDAASACMISKRLSRIIYIVSLVLYAIGGFFAFIAPNLTFWN